MDLLLSGFGSNKPTFDAAKEIPSLSGKVILVTGGTNGLGKETVLSFADHEPAHIFFTGRSQTSADAVLETVASKHPTVPMTFIPCDLASFASIQSAITILLPQLPRLDILIANAGVLGLPPSLTTDGYEIQFGTNHMGHALLVSLLLPVLKRTAATTTTSSSPSPPPPRVIWLTSLAHRLASNTGLHFPGLRSPDAGLGSAVGGAWKRYAQSKLAVLLYARAFARAHPALVSVAVHPGVAETGIATTWGQRALTRLTNWTTMLSVEQCAWNQQWAATALVGSREREVESGGYYEPVGKRGKTPGKSGDDDLADELFRWTQKELEGFVGEV